MSIHGHFSLACEISSAEWICQHLPGIGSSHVFLLYLVLIVTWQCSLERRDEPVPYQIALCLLTSMLVYANFPL